MNTKALVLGALLALVPFATVHAQEGTPSETPVATEAETQKETEVTDKIPQPHKKQERQRLLRSDARHHRS